MKKTLITFATVVGFAAPLLASAAFDDVSLTTDTVLTVNGVTLNVSGSTAAIQSITVSDTSFSVNLAPSSTLEVSAPNLNKLSADSVAGMTTDICNASQSIMGFSAGTSALVTVTPNASTLCTGGSGGGGGGGSAAVAASTPSTSSSASTSSSSSSASTSSSSSSSSASSSTAASTAVTPSTTSAAAVTTTVSTPASGLSSTQVQSILDVLASFDVDAATMASVRAALEGTTTGSVTSAAVHVFKATLTSGSLGSEVKALQQFLNAHGYPVAASGPGSAGNETTRFGPATKAALIKYQKAKGIVPAAGFFGEKTRASVNANQ